MYTDGACSGNPGPGGWAWAVPGGALRQRVPRRTPPTSAWRSRPRSRRCGPSPGPLEVVSDSTYVVNCFRDRWWEGWLHAGLAQPPEEAGGQPRPVGAVHRARAASAATSTFRWVKGHSGDPMNDLVDRLAVEAATTQQHRSGDRAADLLGPADVARWPARSTGLASTEDTQAAVRAEVVAASTHRAALRRARRSSWSVTARRARSATTTIPMRPGGLLDALVERARRPRPDAPRPGRGHRPAAQGAETAGGRGGGRARACPTSPCCPSPIPTSVWPDDGARRGSASWPTRPTRWCCCRTKVPDVAAEARCAAHGPPRRLAGPQRRRGPRWCGTARTTAVGRCSTAAWSTTSVPTAVSVVPRTVSGPDGRTDPVVGSAATPAGPSPTSSPTTARIAKVPSTPRRPRRGGARRPGRAARRGRSAPDGAGPRHDGRHQRAARAARAPASRW